ncbi:MAG: LysR family transcriptional regulator [Rothia sp. (in: high G+C Gram-positive bacteria)]|uniref:LysR family transcriptional regulator n=1 Tax=Rothia sp. (in: high G+C Gram-positive bacteria) TaxID=1885016 RepID=UPI002701A4A1|nr:LysR family transcriptional regulator [Rothia sp. (in: high G+C Gram-positive bacteria)]
MYDLRRLAMLLEIHERGTLAATAKALHLTSSAISQQITTLEKEVGTPLLRKVGRRVELTTEALILVESTRNILKELDAAHTRITLLEGVPAGQVRLAIFQSAAKALLPGTLAHLAEHAPQVQLHVVQIDPETGLSLTRSREFDLVIAESYPHHYIPEYPELTSELLTEDALNLVLAASSPITELAQAAHLPWVFEGAHNTSRTWAINQCRAAGFEPHIRYVIDDLGTHLLLAASGAAAILPSFALPSTEPDLLTQAGIKALPLPGEPERKIFVTVRTESINQPAIRAVKEALKAAVPAAPTLTGSTDGHQ